MRSLGIVLGVIVAFGLMGGCTIMSSYNAIQRRDEIVKQACGPQLLSAYKKRADLIPNLVSAVKGYASHESGTTTKVAELQAGVGRVQLPENASAEDLQRFMQLQKEVGGGIGRLLAVGFASPNLKADQNFLKLQADLKASETQIGAARNRCAREIAAFNVNVRTFPSSITASLFGYSVKPQLQFEDEREIQKVPRVTF